MNPFASLDASLSYEMNPFAGGANGLESSDRLTRSVSDASDVIARDCTVHTLR